MFGFIHESIRQLIMRQYGEDVYLEILKRAELEPGRENLVNQYYHDDETFRIIEAASVQTKLPIPEIWEMYGAFLIEYTMEMGWDELLCALGSNIKEFLDNLDSLHYFIDHVVFQHPQLRGPSFRCEMVNGQLMLHYVSNRTGLFPIVKGVIREVGKRVFNQAVELVMTGRNQRTVVMSSGERLEEHVTFQINIKRSSTTDELSMLTLDAGYGTLSNSPNISTEHVPDELVMKGTDFSEKFPFHVIVDSDLRIMHVGYGFRQHIPASVLADGDRVLHQVFQLNRPRIPLEFDSIVNHINAVFVMQVRQNVSDEANSEFDNTSMVVPSTLVSNFQTLKLKGSMMLLEDRKHLIYLSSPYVADIKHLLLHNMRLDNLPLYDSTRDLILLNQQRLNDVETAKSLELLQEQLKEMAEEMETEKAKAEMVLSEVLPTSVAKSLMAGESVEAREYSEATVLFSDIPNFNNIVSITTPKQIITLLNSLFTNFDRLINLHNVYKVETVGDSYMVVSGLPVFRKDHCEQLCYVALGMLWEANAVLDPHKQSALQIRVGLHSGSIVTGVVGKKMPRYCLFGDTVNTASRMESHGRPGKIHMSDKAMEAAQSTGRFNVQARGLTYIKGKGLMQTYWLKSSEKYSLWEIVERDRELVLSRSKRGSTASTMVSNHHKKSLTCTIL